MSDVTAVPLRPVSKFGIAVLWVGVLLLVLGAAAWAMTLSRQPQIGFETVRAGTGRMPTSEEVAFIKYEGRLPTGEVFDANEFTPMPVGRVVPGFSQALQRMQVGGKYEIRIPAELGYGSEGSGPIPPNTPIEFTVELLDIRSMEETQMMMQQLQMMQQQMQGGGGPEGAGPPPGGAPQAGPPTGP